MSCPVVSAERLGKRFRIGLEPRGRRRQATLKAALLHHLGAPLRNLRTLRHLDAAGERDGEDAFWALRDVSFEVREGEVLGIIGRNGAGKSTLFKILSRITRPTLGRAEVCGRVGSLLEVGTGFHPELTGRENVYLNGSVLGMDRAYIGRVFDRIVDFAGVEAFIDTPVKRYSSGMYLRLAFAVAAHLEPEILIVDEVLAVGDAEFQKKCLGKMGSVARDGRTVLFVSHNMNAIQALCPRCLLLDAGRIRMDGPTHDVVAAYFAMSSCEAAPDTWIDLSRADHAGTGEARFTAVRYSSGDEDAGHRPYPMGPLRVDMVIDSRAPRSIGSLAVTLYDGYGTKLVNAHTGLRGQVVRLQPGRNVVRSAIKAVHLNPGTYVLGLWLADAVGDVFDYIESAFRIELIDLRTDSLGLRVVHGEGIVPCEFELLDQSAEAEASRGSHGA